MKIVQIGANGRTGKKVMQLALDAGYLVTALVRSADSLGDMRHERLKICVGNVCDPEFLKSEFPGHDIVISTVGPRLPTKKACLVYADSANAIAEAMESAGIRRVIITSTALLFPIRKFIDRVIRIIARNNFRAAGLMEQRIRNAGLDWTFARVGFLTDEDAKSYRKAVGEMPEGCGSIARFALAEFLFTELKHSEHIGDVIGLCGDKEA